MKQGAEVQLEGCQRMMLINRDGIQPQKQRARDGDGESDVRDSDKVMGLVQIFDVLTWDGLRYRW